MKQLNTDMIEMRKKLDHMNSVGGMGDLVGAKKQVQDTLNKIITRLNALQAEKNRQIRKRDMAPGHR